MPNELGLTMAAPCGTLTTTVVAAPALTKVFRPGLHCSYFASCIHFSRAGSIMRSARLEKQVWKKSCGQVEITNLHKAHISLAESAGIMALICSMWDMTEI